MTVCKSHVQRSKSGRRICVSCVVHHYDKRAKKAKERREMRAEAAATGTQVGHRSERKSAGADDPAGERLGFDALQDDQDGLYGGAAIGAAAYSPLVDEDALNERVLTGSANARKPVWVMGLVMALVAWMLCFGMLSGTRVGLQQIIYNVLSLIVAFGAVVWTRPAAFAKEAGEIRTRSRIAFAIGFGALLLSGLVFYVRWSG